MFIFGKQSKEFLIIHLKLLIIISIKTYFFKQLITTFVTQYDLFCVLLEQANKHAVS